MNPLVMQFANGNVFFVGLLLMIAAFALAVRQNGRFVGILVRTIWLVGFLLAILSATLLSLWIYTAWAIFSIASFVSLTFWRKQRGMLVALGVVSSLALILIELPYHFARSITYSPTQPVFVLGDSISAGIDTKEHPWPEVLGWHLHLSITNLARPGSTVSDGLRQAAHIEKPGSLVFVELGGNDLLSGTRGVDFHDQLDKLLRTICTNDNTVIMFETPLIPFRNSLGADQRSLARKYGVMLLPKHFLTDVFETPGATLDGLHLSQSGHDALSAEIQCIMCAK